MTNMTNEEAIEVINNRDQIVGYCENERLSDALDMAMNALEQTSHLIDRPCEACEFHKDNGCCKWGCVFEEAEP